MWRRLARVTVESKMTARLLHSTIKQEENNKSRGQYKARVLSRYHQPTQNRKQYISSNIINRLQYSTCSNTSTIIINKYRQVHTWGLTPQYHTHLGIRFIRLSILTSFKIHYLYFSCVGTWHSAPSYSLILLCRYVTLRSPKSMCQFVTPDPLNLRVGSWHPIP